MVQDGTLHRPRHPLLLLVVVSVGIALLLTLGVRGSTGDATLHLSPAGSLSSEIRPLQRGSGLRRQLVLAPTAGLVGVESVLAPDSALPVAAPAATQPGQLSEIAKNSRSALYQSECTICFSGTDSLSWNGGSASFNVPQITNNHSSGTSGSLRVEYVVTSTYPVYGSTINSYQFTGYDAFNPLQAGYYYGASSSGTVASYQASIPAGSYWVVIELLEYNGSGWVYDDFGVESGQVTCNGVTGCTVVAPTPTPTPSSACTPDAYTGCLIGGRYKVTSHWQDQFAGNQVSTLSATRLTDGVAAFWLSDPNTYEYLIRVNTATNNGRAWIAITTFTNVEFWVEVRDTATGQYFEYHSPAGNETLIYDPSFFVYP